MIRPGLTIHDYDDPGVRRRPPTCLRCNAADPRYIVLWDLTDDEAREFGRLDGCAYTITFAVCRTCRESDRELSKATGFLCQGHRIAKRTHTLRN